MGTHNELDRLLRKSRRLKVGDCRVDLSLNEVHDGDRCTRLAPKAAAVLEVLLFMAGQSASKERLLAEVWRGEFPTEDVVTNAIVQLRKAFGDDARASRYIRTVPRVGYVLVAAVGPLVADDCDAPSDNDAQALAMTLPTAASIDLPSSVISLLSLPTSNDLPRSIDVVREWLPLLLALVLLAFAAMLIG